MLIGMTGCAGYAELIDLPPAPAMTETLACWLLTLPDAHPYWTQWTLTVTRVRDVPGMIPPWRDFPTATHRLAVITLNPDTPTTAPQVTATFRTGGRLNWLHITHSIDFDATDREMRDVAHQIVRGCVAGEVTPDAGKQTLWQIHADQALAHVRGYHDQPAPQ